MSIKNTIWNFLKKSLVARTLFHVVGFRFFGRLIFSTFTSAGDSTLNDAEQFVMHESSKKNIWFNRAVLRGKDTAGFYYFPSLSAQLCWKSLHVEVFQSLVEQAKKAKLPPIKQIVFERLSCVQRGDLHLVARDQGVEFMLCG
jgi:hypothetical protein